MNIAQQHHGLSRNIMALVLCAAMGPTLAEEGEDLAQYIKPESSVSVGAGGTSGDSRERSIFGQYNGMRDHAGSLLFDIDYNNREDATGKWTTLEGRNLGIENRELRFMQQQQGDWKYNLEYNQLVHHEIRTINTGMQGAGTTTPTVNLLSAPGSGADLNLELKRERVGLGVEKWLTPSLQLEASIKNEDKDGARLFGKGFACSASWVTDGICGSNTQWGLLMLPEPINSTTRQIEAKLNFSTDKLLLTGGYYASLYSNAYGSVTPAVPATLTNPLGAATALDAGLQTVLGMPVALPPDNQAHQLYLSGNYAFTPATRATFMYAYTHATQNDNFLGNGLTGAPTGRTDLGGVVDTNMLQLGLTTHPAQKLSMRASLRYEDKNDKTPQALYSVEGTDFFTNSKYSFTKISGKVEGSYQLPDNYRATLGVDYESMDRGNFSSPGCAALDPVTGECLGDSVAGLSGLRAKTEELGYRAELRRSISETLTGAISYGRSRRDGTNWLKPNALPATGVTELTDTAIYSRTAIFPMIFMDRVREKVKLQADWYATERLSVQFVVEGGKDQYSAPTTKGLQDTGLAFYSIDAAWTISDNWNLTGYASHGDQTQRIDHSSGYMADLRNLNDAIGIGLVGKPSGRIQVGADLSYINDRNIYDQELDALASANNQTFFAQFGGLPDVLFRQIRLKLFGTYALEKNASLRLDLAHQISKLDEWTWGYNGVPFIYSDNTTVTLDPDQHVTFAGVSYIYKWQ